MKLSYLAIIAFSVVSCTQNDQNTVTTDQYWFGENYDSTSYIDVIKASFKDIEAYDSVV